MMDCQTLIDSDIFIIISSIIIIIIIIIFSVA